MTGEKEKCIAAPTLQAMKLFDNMLWGGRLGTTRITQASGRAIDKLNRKLARDKRVESVLLPIADGLQLCRKR